MCSKSFLHYEYVMKLKYLLSSYIFKGDELELWMDLLVLFNKLDFLAD